MRIHSLGRCAAMLGAWLGAPLIAAGAQQAPLELTRLSAPVTVDGALDDAGWRDVPALPLTMYAPVYEGTPTQRTELRVAYDDEFLYIGGWMHDTDPDGIRINSLYRDRWNGDDALAIYIDPFNDNVNAKWFGTTAAGMRFDLLLSDDGAASNDSWDAFWDSRTTVTREGWFVEVRIPFSTIGFRVDDSGRTTMGLTLTRLVSRLGERVTFPAIDPRFDFRRPSVAQDVVLRDVRTRKPLYVSPYALSGVSRKATPVTPTGYTAETATASDVGLDVRYPVSAGLTLDLTVNTDFAQVEADEQQVNLDRFPLFFPERRRFFQEGSGLFEFTGGLNTRLFNSRRIGLTSAGTPVPVQGGARVVGRAGGWDVGALAMRTGEQGATPAEGFGVLRLRRPVLNQYSNAGAMLTAYSGRDRTNLGGGLDATLRVTGDHFLGVKLAGTMDDSATSSGTLLDRGLVDLQWGRRVSRGFQYDVLLTRVGREFRPELGFLPRRDFSRVSAFSNWYFFTDDHPYFRRVYPGVVFQQVYRNGDRVLESGTYAFWVQWDTKRGGGGWLEPKWFRENVASAFPIGPDITIPAGTYDFMDFQAVYTAPAGDKLRMSVDARAGTYFDGRRTQVILRPTWNASRHLELGADYQLSMLRFPSRDQADDISVARLRVRTAMDVRLSGNAFIQYNTASDALDFNVRLRYALREGTDLWLVYNEGLDTDRVEGAPMSMARSVILKYTHTFVR